MSALCSLIANERVCCQKNVLIAKTPFHAAGLSRRETEYKDWLKKTNKHLFFFSILYVAKKKADMFYMSTLRLPLNDKAGGLFVKFPVTNAICLLLRKPFT